MAELTPMMRQYFDIKQQYPDYILFYRLGDFYEMFFEDARLASKELELTLTGRDCGQEERAPMCGVPYHAAETYIARLVRRGYKIAICEQVEDPKATKGLVKREIVRMITPGTIVEASMLDENNNNFLACIYGDTEQIGACFADISTGEVHATILQSSKAQHALTGELGRFVPREALIAGAVAQDATVLSFLNERLTCSINILQDEIFSTELDQIIQQFQITDLKATGLEDAEALVRALNGLLAYLTETQKTSLGNLNTLQVFKQGQYMQLDLTARRNLELCETLRTKERKGSLLWVMDCTHTAMGARLLRQWLEKPLLNPIHVKKRQDAIGSLIEDIVSRSELIERLKKIFDMERLIGRIVYGTANGRDLRALYATMTYLPEIKQLAGKFQNSALLQELTERIDLLNDIKALIDVALVEEPPVSIKDGGFIRTGYSKQVDELRDMANGGKGKIAEIEQRERERTGIKNLKIGYNRVFGYFIEISRNNTSAVPEEYIRKQTLANCERYITSELKEYENAVLGAQDKLTALEYELFCQLRENTASKVHCIQRTAQALSNLDVLCALAELAEQNHYVCPQVDFSGRIDIRDGRHPVVEKMLKDNLFIPNDTMLDSEENRAMIITGPNMAGKSTYMRQVALITIMAQIGSYVPAASARIGVVDRVFTRVGASDDLTSGQSTFMVEMSEVAEILNHATKNSLLILDEIGRGTSTYDGMSIARAVVEYTVDKRKLGARTLFATHYHELTALEQLLDGVKNYNIAVKKRGDDITFLRKIIRGGADDSYGIEVAKLAGVPNSVIRRAKHILEDLESNSPKIEVRAVAEDTQQITMEQLGDHQAMDRLRTLQVETMTPIE